MQMTRMKWTSMIGNTGIIRILGFHLLKDSKQSSLVITKSESFSLIKKEEEIIQDLCPLWWIRSSTGQWRSCLLLHLDSSRRGEMRSQRRIVRAKEKGRRVVMVKAKVESIQNPNVGHVAWLGIGQRIPYARRNRVPFMKVRQRGLDSTQNPIKTTAKVKLQSQSASFIRIQGSASLGLSAVSFTIRTTDRI